MKYHIEFIGLPGSGKTTYSKELVKVLNYKNITTYTLNDAYLKSINRTQANEKHRLFFTRILKRYCKKDKTKLRIDVDSIISFIIDNPALFENILSVQFRRIQSRPMRYVVLSYVMKLCSMFRFVEDTLHEHESVVLDEGFVYAPVRTIEAHNTLRECDFNDYLDLIPKPDIIIYLQCSSHLSEDRISKRPDGYPGRLNTYSIEKRQAYLTTCNDCIKYIINYMVTDNRFIITIDSSLELTTNVEIIKKQVFDFVQQNNN